jgi:hypothetical protein
MVYRLSIEATLTGKTRESVKAALHRHTERGQIHKPDPRIQLVSFQVEQARWKMWQNDNFESLLRLVESHNQRHPKACLLGTESRSWQRGSQTYWGFPVMSGEFLELIRAAKQLTTSGWQPEVQVPYLAVLQAGDAKRKGSALQRELKEILAGSNAEVTLPDFYLYRTCGATGGYDESRPYLPPVKSPLRFAFSPGERATLRAKIHGLTGASN